MRQSSQMALKHTIVSVYHKQCVFEKLYSITLDRKLGYTFHNIHLANQSLEYFYVFLFYFENIETGFWK